MRVIATLGLVLVLGACTSGPASHLELTNPESVDITYVLPSPSDANLTEAALAFGEGATYMVSVPVHDGRCYLRVRDGLAVDQVCQVGDMIRYSPDAPLATSLQPVPSHILALFDMLSAAGDTLTADRN